MKAAVKQFLQHFHLLVLAKEIKEVAKLIKYQFHRNFGLIDKKILNNYLDRHEIRKLQIGSGFNIISGWLNSDYRPVPKDLLRLDATKKFPIDDNEFDYIFSEHIIEHIEYAEGLSMLHECFRVLRHNGTIRVSTPNLPFLLDLYRHDKSEQQIAYIKWATDNFIPGTDYYDDIFVINNYVRDWGHQFIYDEKTLRASLEKAGFTNITRCKLNQSEEEVFRNLENESRLPAGFLQIETLTLEGKKLINS
jgi:predicted SAM-dependent methyltransferase